MLMAGAPVRRLLPAWVAGQRPPRQQLSKPRLPAARPPDVSLDSSKAYEVGYDPASIQDALNALLDR